jgi:WD40 repeat protein
MALANIAELMYRVGLKVLVIDWDLEAPGLERYFPLDPDSVLRQPGLIDMLLKYKENMTRVLPKGTLPFEAPEPYFINVYPEEKSAGQLLLLTAGRRLGVGDFASYSRQVRDFDWKDFYDNWEAEFYFNWLRKKFEDAVDVVLIDSRTGVTEMGGASIYQFADVAVLFCGTSTQNLDGIVQVAKSFGRPLVEQARGRPLPMLIVPSRVENRAGGREGQALLDTFRNNFTHNFESYLSSELGDDPTFLWKLKIPYVPLYALSERVATREPDQQNDETETLVIAYANLASAMAHLAPEDKASYGSLAQAMERLGKVVSREHPAGSTAEAMELSPASTGGDGVTGASGDQPLSLLLPFDIRESVPRFQPPPSPYPGTGPYRAQDEHFYGRTAETRRMVQDLVTGDFILVLGPSSSGKSSLLAPGLVPAVLGSTYWKPAFWAVLEMRPGPEPVHTFGRLLECDLDNGTGPVQAVTGWLEAHRPAQRLLLVVDSFEEIFRLASPQERSRFIDIIRELYQSGTCAVVVGSRSDVRAELQAHNLWPESDDYLIELTPLEGDNLRTAIRQPADDLGVAIDPELVERLIADAGNEPGRMPLLQATLRLLWDKIERRTIRLSAYERLGGTQVMGLVAAIAPEADKVLAALGPGQQEIARRMLIRLVQFGFGRPDISRQQPVSALQAVGDDPQLFTETLTALSDGHLVVLDSHDGGGKNLPVPTVDLAHAALVQGWPILRKWINHLRDAEIKRRKLEDRANEWVRLGKGESGQLDLGESQEAEEWLADPAAKELGYSQLLVDLVQTSKATQQAARDREVKQARRLVYAIAAAAIFGLAFIVFVFASLALTLNAQRQFADVQKQIAEREGKLDRARTFARISLDAIDTDPELSLLLAMEAVSTTHDLKNNGIVLPEAENALHQALLNSRVRRAFVDKAALPDAVLTGIAYNSTGCTKDEPTNCFVVTTDSKGFIRVWNTTDGLPIKKWQYSPKTSCQPRNSPTLDPKKINNVSFSGDGQYMITAGDDCTAQVWVAAQVWDPSIPDPTPVASLVGHENQVWNASLNNDGTRAVTASGDGTARVWSLDKLETAPVISAVRNLTHDKGQPPPLADAKFSPNDLYIATTGSDRQTILWRASDGLEITRLQGHTETVWSVAFSPIITSSTELTLATCGDDGSLLLWNVSLNTPKLSVSSQVSRTLQVLNGGWNRVLFNSDGEYVLAGGDNNNASVVRVHEAGAGPDVIPLLGHSRAVRAVAFSPAGDRVVTASEDSTVRLWDWSIRGTEELPTLSVSPGSPTGINDVSFSPDGKGIVTANDDGRVTLWRFPTDTFSITSTMTLFKSLDGKAGAVNTAVYSSDSSNILSAHKDRTVNIWDVASGTRRVPFPIPQHRNPVVSAEYSPDGKRIVTARNLTIADRNVISPSAAIVWDIAPADPTKYNPTYLELPLAEAHITCAVFDPTGSFVATCSDNSGEEGYLTIWDVSQRVALSKIVAHFGPVLGADWSNNGEIVTVGQDWTGKIWKVAPPFDRITESRTLSGHISAVTSVAFSLDGKQIVTSSSDGTARVWDIEGDTERAILRGHTYEGHVGRVRVAALSPDGSIIATAGEDGTVRLYLNDIDMLMALAKSRVTRTLTPKEENIYLGKKSPSLTPIPRP